MTTNFEDFFEEEMSSVWTAEAEFGWLIGHDELQTVSLEHLMMLREEWPGRDDALTAIETFMDIYLDAGITACLLGLGAKKVRIDGKEKFSWGTPAKGTPDILRCRKLATIIHSLVEKTLEAHAELGDAEMVSDTWGAIRELAQATLTVQRDGIPEWWEMLGWDSYADWKTFHRHVADPTWAGIEDWKNRHPIA